MTRLPALVLLLLSAALGGWVLSTADDPADAADTVAPAKSRPLPAAPVAAAHDDGQRRRNEVATILARPVFSSTRRPKEDAATPAQPNSLATLPRMSAILINGGRRSAIFDGKDKPIVLGEGGHLGPFTVQSIEPQQVTVTGPGGKRVVRTSFSNDPPPAPPPELPQASPLRPPPPVPVILPPGMPNPGLAYPGASR